MLGEFGLVEPVENAFSITPSDADNLRVTRGLYVGATGNIRVTMAGGQTVTLTDLQAGVIHPLRVVKVFNTSTTATGIVGFF